jgi:hypothetical protein
LHDRTRVFRASFFGLVWLIAIGAGGTVVLSYETSPGQTGTIPKYWPRESTLERAADRPTLIMIAHPRCPCTRASIGELAKIVAQTQSRVRTYVLLWKPAGAEREWTANNLENEAKEIPGIQVLDDVGGQEAQRFGIETSGHTVVFNKAGELLFSGGITQSRGHSGDNAGEEAIVSLINQGSAPLRSTVAFGCPIKERNREQTPCRK